jgi:hypothetical protein
VCSNGGEGSQFDIIFDSSLSLTSDALASADGITPGVACCACGGLYFWVCYLGCA